MERVYDLHQHTYCVAVYIGKTNIVIDIVPNSNRDLSSSFTKEIGQDASIAYNEQRTNVTYFGWDYEKRGEDDILIDNFRDGLYNLFKKDKETWNEEDNFFMKAVSDYLPLALKRHMELRGPKIENFDLLHYVFIVPSEWEEEIRDEIIRPVFVQSGLISKEDHQDRLLFYTDIESFCYYHKYSFERGGNTIMCRITPEEEVTTIKFDLIQTTTTLFNFPNAQLFPKVMNSCSTSFTTDYVQSRIKDFLRVNLFLLATTDGGSVRETLNPELDPSDQDRIIEAIMKEVYSNRFLLLERRDDDRKDEPWITLRDSWVLNKSQKEFINSLRPSIIFAEIGTFLLGPMKEIVSNNFTKSYRFRILKDDSFGQGYDIRWQESILKYNCRSLNYTVDPTIQVITTSSILQGAGRGVSEAIQHADMYCKPRIVSPVDLTTSSSVFLNSKPDAIINLDISLGSTLFTCLLLDEDGLIQHVFDHDYFIGDNLPPLGNFYAFSSTATFNVKEQFISFAERYLLGYLSGFTADDDVPAKNDILLEMKAILIDDLCDGEVLVSIKEKKYIKAFILMYMIYIKEEILHKMSDQLISDQTDMKIGYAVSIEAMLLNNTLESKYNLRDIIYASRLVLKDDSSKKLRITTQGERILPAIQKSLKLELSLRSYFLLCQLHEDYVQLSLHQVVTAYSPEEKEQESIIVQDEIIPIQNIYDSLCSIMWCNLQRDSNLIELCEMHNTGDNSKIFELFLSNVKADFFANLKRHISDNVLQNNHGTENTDAVNLTRSCNCKVRLTASEIINISFTPVLQDIACTLSASLLNKELFGSYINIDYLFSFIRFSNNLQIQYALAKILEEGADDFNLEAGIDTICLVVPGSFNQLLRPVITQQPFCYKDFKIGALQQVSSENYGFSLHNGPGPNTCFKYKSKITDTKTIECGPRIGFPFLNKGEVTIHKSDMLIHTNTGFNLLDVWRFETMDYLDNNETLSLRVSIYKSVDNSSIFFDEIFESKDVDVPFMVSVRYVSYTSSFQFSVKIVGADTKNEHCTSVFDRGEPLTLARF